MKLNVVKELYELTNCHSSFLKELFTKGLSNLIPNSTGSPLDIPGKQLLGF